jgi:hypothetical protein
MLEYVAIKYKVYVCILHASTPSSTDPKGLGFPSEVTLWEIEIYSAKS